jgi:hypothetical protein
MIGVSGLLWLLAVGAASTTTLGLRVQTDVKYDSNILRYSDEDLDAFVINFKQDRFASAETYDDLLIIPLIRVTVDRRGLGEVTLSWKETVFWNNPVKQYRVLSAAASVPFLFDTDLDVGVFRLPHYHIRPLYDVDQSAYVSCNFAKTRLWATLDRSIPGGHRVSLSYRWEREDYVDEFYEYDNTAHTIRLQVKPRLTRSFRPTISYSFVSSPARAYDEAGEDALASDETDGSYFEDQFRLSLRRNLAKVAGRTFYGQTSATYRVRHYTTEKHPHLDPYHAGRLDRRVLWNVSVGWRWTTSTLVWASYELEKRWSEGTVEATDLGEEKEFLAHRPSLGVRLSWSLRK